MMYSKRRSRRWKHTNSCSSCYTHLNTRSREWQSIPSGKFSFQNSAQLHKNILTLLFQMSGAADVRIDLYSRLGDTLKQLKKFFKIANDWHFSNEKNANCLFKFSEKVIAQVAVFKGHSQSTFARSKHGDTQSLAQAKYDLAMTQLDLLNSRVSKEDLERSNIIDRNSVLSKASQNFKTSIANISVGLSNGIAFSNSDISSKNLCNSSI